MKHLKCAGCRQFVYTVPEEENPIGRSACPRCGALEFTQL